MPSSQQRRALGTPVFKSTLGAAWLFGALCLGQLTQQYLSPKSKVGTGPRTGTIGKSVSPSQPMPSAPLRESETANAMPAGALWAGALAAAAVALAALTGGPQLGKRQEPVPVHEQSSSVLVQVIGAEQAPQRAAASVAPPAVDTVAKGMAAAATFSCAAVAATAVQPSPLRPVATKSAPRGSARRSASAAKGSSSSSSSSTATTTTISKGTPAKQRSSSAAGRVQAPRSSSLTTPMAAVMQQRASPSMPWLETVTGVKKVAVAASPMGQQAQTQAARMTDQRSELRRLLLSTPTSTKRSSR
mmetsp:Transcript_77533/g.227347  ORF Transcript_77533/g.227347 Transcript_77533/m.227347 type:complete len:302 (+) Transcript_77533:63-968(+)